MRSHFPTNKMGDCSFQVECYIVADGADLTAQVVMELNFIKKCDDANFDDDKADGMGINSFTYVVNDPKLTYDVRDYFTNPFERCAIMVDGFEYFSTKNEYEDLSSDSNSDSLPVPVLTFLRTEKPYKWHFELKDNF